MIIQLLCIVLVDFINIQMHYFINKFTLVEFKNCTRWFLLHSMINSIIVYYSLPDLIECYKNPTECYKIPWNNNSINVYNYALLLHIYHCLFFKLTRDDYLHHFLMVIICGILCYGLQSIIISFALFFLTGLPGAIDYMLLYLVKIKKLDIIIEKNIYLYLSLFIRSPGCICTTLIGSYGIIDYLNRKEYINLFVLSLNLLLIFWNGQYYLMRCYKSYIYKSIEASKNKFYQ